MQNEKLKPDWVGVLSGLIEDFEAEGPKSPYKVIRGVKELLSNPEAYKVKRSGELLEQARKQCDRMRRNWLAAKAGHNTPELIQPPPLDAYAVSVGDGKFYCAASSLHEAIDLVLSFTHHAPNAMSGKLVSNSPDIEIRSGDGHRRTKSLYEAVLNAKYPQILWREDDPCHP